MSKGKDVYLVVLQGGGDTYVTLINEKTWNWINSPYDDELGFDGSYDEVIPKSVAKHMDENTICITRGSYDNDRALVCPGESFDSVKEALKHIKTNKFNLVDEYHGYSY